MKTKFGLSNHMRHMKMKNKILIFIAFFYLGTGVFAQKINFKRIDTHNGLINNHVSSLLVDSKGFVWIGTQSGLCRFDGANIKSFRRIENDSTSLVHDDIFRISELPDGKLYISTTNGDCFYNPFTESFDRNLNKAKAFYGITADIKIFKTKRDNQSRYWLMTETQGIYCLERGKTTKLIIKDQKTELTDIAITSDGNVWLSFHGGRLMLIDSKSHKIIKEYHLPKQSLYTDLNYLKLYVDNSNDLWCYSLNNIKGVFLINSKSGQIRQFDKSNGCSNMISAVTQDKNGLMWFGTDHDGVILINKETNRLTSLKNSEFDERSLSQDVVISLMTDNQGIVWVGTFKEGLNYYHPDLFQFEQWQSEPQNSKSLPINDINCLYEDLAENIWMGTNGNGLIYYDRKSQKFTSLNGKNTPGFPAGNIVLSLHQTKDGRMFIGTYLNGLYIYEGNRFSNYQAQKIGSEYSIVRNIWAINEDYKGRIWVATLGGGVCLYNQSLKQFETLKFDFPYNIPVVYSTALDSDNKGLLYIATTTGLVIYDANKNKVVKFLTTKEGLSGVYISTVKIDSRGLVWIGTSGGVSVYDPVKKSIIGQVNGLELPETSVRRIEEDKLGGIWISTPLNITHVKVSSRIGGEINCRSVIYDQSYGITQGTYNNLSSCVTKRGEMCFGSSKGVTIFNPEKIKPVNVSPQVIVTDFQIFNKSIRPGEVYNNRIVITKSLLQKQEVDLFHDDQVFSIEFAVLDFFHPSKHKYAYKMDGFDDNWVTADPNFRKATYTQLPPGKYKFRVRVASNASDWIEQDTTLVVHVNPPFWRTTFAYFLYLLIIIGLIIYSRRRMIRVERERYAMEQEKKDAQRKHEIDEMKVNFVTNVSHEFRTPLALLMLPLEKLMDEETNADKKKNLLSIYVNAKRLLNLANTLLDLQKLDSGKMKASYTMVDFVAFCRNICSSFVQLYESKKISFIFSSEIEELSFYLDQDLMQKVVFNLLSNAFKFTSEGGHVSVLLGVENKIVNGESKAYAKIRISDTGIGIPVENQKNVFERFFQNELPAYMINQGSGIGLSMVKEFVELHNGLIELQSEVGKGSVFTVLLPFDDSLLSSEIVASDNEEYLLSDSLSEEEDADSADRKKHLPTLLLVEDNSDFRFYLKENLKDKFVVFEASNGKDGYDQAISILPDIVVSDVMMPLMNGLDLCRMLKSEPATSHIPVILLTARASQDQNIEGLESGADDFITKPFNLSILLLRIKNLITQREKVQKQFMKHIEVNPSEITVTSIDEQLIVKAVEFVEKNIEDPDFTVEELSRLLDMSRMQLYKKVLAITGKTPVEFIRTIRMKRALQLIKQGQYTIAEVTYKVGYNNPKYFAKFFKKEFGVLPSFYKTKKNPGQEDIESEVEEE